MQAVPPPDLSNGRFRALEPVASGSFGTIYRAFDGELGRHVALKVLHGEDPAEALELKNEFRMLRRVVHPNVVRFHELFTQDRKSFYTMDLIHGRTIDRWWNEVQDVGRLVALARQLLFGVCAVHAAGATHRDIKPANLLVGEDDELTIVDFGLAHSTRPVSEWETRDVSGTYAYMAPEAFAGVFSSASDWFSVGAVLFELLTGRLPYSLRSLHHVDAELALPEGNEGFRRLVQTLMSPDPLVRRTAVDDYLASLGPGVELPAEAPAGRDIFVGRAGEMRVLAAELEAVRGGARVVHVQGPSGIGKSELARRFLSEAARRGAVVFQGRCHTAERVPYNALDEVIDDLARYVAIEQAGPSIAQAIAPEARAALVRLFPVLSRSGDFGSALPPVPVDSVRELAVSALRSLLASIAAQRPIVLLLEDVHWGDEESASLLDEVLADPAPGLLLLLTYRWREARFLASLRLEHLAHRSLPLEPLDQEALREWIAACGPAGDVARLVRSIMARGDTSPFLIQELLQSRLIDRPLETLDFRTMLIERISGLEPEERALLDTAVVAGRPVDWQVLARAAGLDASARLTAQHLAARSLIQLRTVSDRLEVSIYHDRIREALAGTLAEHARHEIHRNLAESLETSIDSFPDPEPVFLHWLGAGNRAKAGVYAERAAARASDVLAFERAARLLREAVDLADSAGDRRRRMVALAEALAGNGRSQEAADVYRRAAELPASSAGTEDSAAGKDRLLANAYRLVMQSGRGIDGNPSWNALRARLDGDEATPRSHPWSRVATRLLPWRGDGFWRGRGMSASAAERFDLDWELSSCEAWLRPANALAPVRRHLRRAVHVGDRFVAFRALVLAATVHSAAGEDGARESRRLLRAARSVADPGDGRCRAMLEHADGMVAANGGSWRESAEALDRADSQLEGRRHWGAWQHAQALEAGCSVHAWLGDYAWLAASVPRAVQDARSRGDHLLAGFLCLGAPALHRLAADEPAKLREDIALAGVEWNDTMPDMRHYSQALIDTFLLRYEKRDLEADALTRGRWTTLERLGVTGGGMTAVLLQSLRGHGALSMLASGAATGAQRAGIERELEVAVEFLRRSRVRPASAFALQLEARRAQQRGEHEACAAKKSSAARLFRRLGMAMHAAACELHGPDALRREEALRTMLEKGIVRPERFALVLDPD